MHWPRSRSFWKKPATSDKCSNTSTDPKVGYAIGDAVSLSVNQQTLETHECRPSPFTPSLRVKPKHQEVDEQILYHIERRSDDIISWVDDPEQQRIPLDLEDDRAAEEPPLPAASQEGSPLPYGDHVPTSSSRSLVIESEAVSLDTPFFIPPSPSSVSALSRATSTSGTTDDYDSPQIYPTRLSVASSLDELRGALQSPPQCKRDGLSNSTWEKVKNTFGRRSRSSQMPQRQFARKRASTPLSDDTSNSNETRHTSASHYSAASFRSTSSFRSIASHHSAGPAFPVPLLQSPKRPEPVPPASASDLLKYEDAKLLPFPGMRKLEEQRNLARAAVDRPAVRRSSWSNSSPSSLVGSPSVSGAAPAPLPSTREGVKRWLSARKYISSQNPSSSSFSASPSPVDSNDGKLPTLSDLLKHQHRKTKILPSSIWSASVSTHSSQSHPGSPKGPEARDDSSQSSIAESSEDEAAAELSSKCSSRRKELSALFTAFVDRMEGYTPWDGAEKKGEGEVGKWTAGDAGPGQTSGSVKSSAASMQQQSTITSSMMPSARWLNEGMVEADLTPEGCGVLTEEPQTEFNLLNNQNDNPQEVNRTLEEIFDGVLGFQSQLRELILAADPGC